MRHSHSTEPGYGATRCAVLRSGMMLHPCYAMCGTGLGYDATTHATRCAVLTYCMVLQRYLAHAEQCCSGTISLRHVRYQPSV
eukprot:2418742-Rhodomonas_salina.1